MLGKLSDSLQSIVSKLTGAAHVDQVLIEDTVKEIQRALISADVSIQLVFELSERIRERTKSEKLPGGMTRKQHVVQIVYDELLRLLGEGRAPPMDKKRILLLGLFGSGKTTTVAKIAHYYQKRGLRPGIIGTDTWRPAAFEQLKQLTQKINLTVQGDPKGKDPVSIIKKTLPNLKKEDVIILDSAGRDAVDPQLIEEIKGVTAAFQPDEKWLVLSADIGQKAGEIAEAFNGFVGLTGVIITKMEGTAKGGGALSAVAHARVPIVFIGVGEKIEALEEFEPKRFLQRLLGMGDIKKLMEMAQAVAEDEDFNPEEILHEQYTLSTFYKQLKAQKKMGPMKDVLQMMGVQAKLPPEVLQTTEDKLTRYKYAMDSMTKQELENPELLTHSRIERIAKGSGAKISDVKNLLSDFGKSKKLVKVLKKGRMPRAFRRMMGSFKGMQSGFGK